MTRSGRRARALLDQGVAPLWSRLYEKRAKQLILDFEIHLRSTPLSPYLEENDAYFRKVLVDFLRGQVSGAVNQIERLRRGWQRFDARFARAGSSREREALLLDYARELGASPRQLRSDRRALKRWLAEDALRERWQGQVAAAEQRLDFAMERLGFIVAGALQNSSQADGELLTIWQPLRFDDLLATLLGAACDSRVLVTALKALMRCLRRLPLEQARAATNGMTQQQIHRLALDPDEPVWLQCAALELTRLLAPDTLLDTLRYRFEEPGEGDDLFVRACAVEVWRDALPVRSELLELVELMRRDPAPLVRQRLASILPAVGELLGEASETLAANLGADPEPAVRAALLLAVAALAQAQPGDDRWLGLMADALRGEQHEFVFRVALEALVQVAPALRELEAQRGALVGAIGARHRQDPSLRIRRWSAQARERFLCAVRPDWQQLAEALKEQLASGARTLDLSALPAEASQPVLMRIFAVLAQQDHGVDVSFADDGRASVRRGHQFAFRLWRWLHEWRHPSTDKRQGFRHTVGRRFQGTQRAPSSILAEVSQTKVPGEPLTLEEEDGWRPYLPLVDECLAALEQDRTLEVHRIFTSEGVTEIEPPATLRRQLAAWWRLTRRFAEFAESRNWREGDAGGPDRYVERLRDLGFKVRFVPHADPATGEPCADPAVARFFPAMAPLPLLGDVLAEFKSHALSAYENTVLELTAYVVVIATAFFGRHVVLASLLRRARQRLPLVIGGWGTRGKSGTERLKAAMFNALGLSVFSKTTGCEAMFVMNRPYREPKELFLFRPYDKATIWEQYNMVRLASRLDSDVFLWECMGLTPAYINVLQHDWMRDDVATITNTFPDHEDLQGPAGVNIPEVMCEFVPPGARLITTEEKMLPILARDAAAKGTDVRAVGWLAAGLLTPDVLDRFPYEEHPYNIALVLALADELGIGRDFALKEMADRVVMDLGVLKAYPTAEVAGRRIEFIMGMSANERFGALSNWQRMGLADATVAASPGTWICTLVNNRADRVARSRVFADLLVGDVQADQHVLIGTNLKGLRGYLDEALERWLNDLSPLAGDADARALVLERAAALRVPASLAELRGRLGALLENDAPLAGAETLPELESAFVTEADGEELAAWGMRFIDQHRQLQELLEVLSADDFGERLRAQLEAWYLQKLVVVEDAHISGDDLVRYIAAALPPGLTTRMMGMQNIKGTGLGFVYCWQAFEQQWLLASRLGSEDPAEFAEALARLAGQAEIGELGRQFLLAALEQARHHPAAQREAAQAQLAALLDRLAMSGRPDGSAAAAPQPRRPGWADRLLDGVEALLDAGDAVRRRRLADQVYEDLVAQQISEDRAILEIKTINARQKGGWLRRRLGL